MPCLPRPTERRPGSAPATPIQRAPPPLEPRRPQDPLLEPRLAAPKIRPPAPATGPTPQAAPAGSSASSSPSSLAMVDGEESFAKRSRKLQPTRAAACASPLATAAPAAYYPVIADPLLQGTGGAAAISVPSSPPSPPRPATPTSRRRRQGWCRTRGREDGGLGLAEQPLNGLAVGLEPQLAGELEHARRAHDRHPHAPPMPVHLAVPVHIGAIHTRSGWK